MASYAYKTVTIDQKGIGFGSRKIPELEEILNQAGSEGWRFRDVVLPSGAFGESNKAIVIFERAQD